MRTILAFCIAVAFGAPVSAQDLPQIERDALIALYNSTDGDNWSDNTGWLGPVGTECSWNGVTCNGGGGWPVNVKYIHLPNNHLVGSIPPELGDLSSDKFLTLTLAINQLSGEIPPELGNLHDLEYLSLQTNQLSGSIPPELGNLSSLINLTLYENQLTGPIPPELGNLSNLFSLVLWDNQLSGSIPPELGNLSNLGSLALWQNQLTGSIPPELGNLSSLMGLYLWANHIGGSIPPELGNLSNLLNLDLQINCLGGNIPPELGDLPIVEYLLLGQNKLSGNIPTELIDPPNLVSLGLGYNALWTDDPVLRDYLDSQWFRWYETQTIKPNNLAVTSVGDRTVWLQWTYPDHLTYYGGYEVFSIELPGQGEVSRGLNNGEVTFPATGLHPGQEYDFTVSRFSWPHEYNQNRVISDREGPVTAATSNSGCATPTVTVTNYATTARLTVTSTHDSYLWSTGSTESNILVSISENQGYFWVRTLGPGSCDEAAVVSLTILFNDDFESGGASAWSLVVGWPGSK